MIYLAICNFIMTACGTIIVSYVASRLNYNIFSRLVFIAIAYCIFHYMYLLSIEVKKRYSKSEDPINDDTPINNINLQKEDKYIDLEKETIDNVITNKSIQTDNEDILSQIRNYDIENLNFTNIDIIRVNKILNSMNDCTLRLLLSEIASVNDTIEIKIKNLYVHINHLLNSTNIDNIINNYNDAGYFQCRNALILLSCGKYANKANLFKFLDYCNSFNDYKINAYISYLLTI